jgi:hypothetical protein
VSYGINDEIIDYLESSGYVWFLKYPYYQNFITDCLHNNDSTEEEDGKVIEYILEKKIKRRFINRIIL